MDMKPQHQPALQQAFATQAAWSRRQMLGSTLALSALGAALPGCGGGGNGNRMQAAASQLPALARSLQQTTGVPGIAWAVVHGGETIAAQGLGVCRAGGSDAVDADTVFQLASVSKSLGATVVARQVGEGRVSWDSRMRELLPWFALSNASSTDRLTVGDLYAHRSGLPDHAGDKLEELGYSQREVLERLQLLPVKPLRSAYAYTNAGLTAAAIGVAQAVGSDWATLSQQSLYAPLGMARTTSVFDVFMRQSNRAVSHVRADDGSWIPGPSRNADPQSPAGGASSSVNDMARWLALLLAQGRWQGSSLIAPAALQPMWQPQAPGGAYGYGFNVGATESGLAFVSHSGAFVLGAATCFMLVPTLDVAIVTLTNGVPIGVPETLCRQFVDMAANGFLTRDWWAMYSKAIAPLLAPTGSLLNKQPPSPVVPAGPLAQYAGSYNNAYYGPLQVDVVGNALQLTLGPIQQTYVLNHWSGDQFTFAPANESATPHSISLASFSFTNGAASVWLEFYDDDGQGVFVRS